MKRKINKIINKFTGKVDYSQEKPVIQIRSGVFNGIEDQSYVILSGVPEQLASYVKDSFKGVFNSYKFRGEALILMFSAETIRRVINNNQESFTITIPTSSKWIVGNKSSIAVKNDAASTNNLVVTPIGEITYLFVEHVNNVGLTTVTYVAPLLPGTTTLPKFTMNGVMCDVTVHTETVSNKPISVLVSATLDMSNLDGLVELQEVLVTGDYKGATSIPFFDVSSMAMVIKDIPQIGDIITEPFKLTPKVDLKIQRTSNVAEYIYYAPAVVPGYGELGVHLFVTALKNGTTRLSVLLSNDIISNDAIDPHQPLLVNNPTLGPISFGECELVGIPDQLHISQDVTSISEQLSTSGYVKFVKKELVRETLAARSRILRHYVLSPDNAHHSSVEGVATSSSGPYRQTGKAWYGGMEDSLPDLGPNFTNNILQGNLYAQHVTSLDWMRMKSVIENGSTGAGFEHIAQGYYHPAGEAYHANVGGNGIYLRFGWLRTANEWLCAKHYLSHTLQRHAVGLHQEGTGTPVTVPMMTTVTDTGKKLTKFSIQIGPSVVHTWIPYFIDPSDDMWGRVSNEWKAVPKHRPYFSPVEPTLVPEDTLSTSRDIYNYSSYTGTHSIRGHFAYQPLCYIVNDLSSRFLALQELNHVLLAYNMYEAIHSGSEWAYRSNNLAILIKALHEGKVSLGMEGVIDPTLYGAVVTLYRANAHPFQLLGNTIPFLASSCETRDFVREWYTSFLKMMEIIVGPTGVGHRERYTNYFENFPGDPAVWGPTDHNLKTGAFDATMACEKTWMPSYSGYGVYALMPIISDIPELVNTGGYSACVRHTHDWIDGHWSACDGHPLSQGNTLPTHYIITGYGPSVSPPPSHIGWYHGSSLYAGYAQRGFLDERTIYGLITAMYSELRGLNPTTGLNPIWHLRMGRMINQLTPLNIDLLTVTPQIIYDNLQKLASKEIEQYQFHSRAIQYIWGAALGLYQLLVDND